MELIALAIISLLLWDICGVAGTATSSYKRGWRVFTDWAGWVWFVSLVLCLFIAAFVIAKSFMEYV
jgi:ABC-type multidrug transport system permease subunit